MRQFQTSRTDPPSRSLSATLRYLTWDLSRDLEIQVVAVDVGYSLVVEASGEEEDSQILAVFECVQGSHNVGQESRIALRDLLKQRVFGMLPEKVLLLRSRACKCWSLGKLRVEISPLKKLLRRKRVVRLVHFVREGGKVPLRVRMSGPKRELKLKSRVRRESGGGGRRDGCGRGLCGLGKEGYALPMAAIGRGRPVEAGVEGRGVGRDEC
ncbi:hypothetical protein SASPL_135681 [Salvia splendens]|uniref:Uncharacterized protein n=1 Tax=Salvia splendens TaxID=180675 RepID=A0A8X8WZC3_SALSN|nr:hypothetical protein SASPL_135681 [Salvia splendens]